MNEVKNYFLTSFVAAILVAVIFFEFNFDNPSNDKTTVLTDQSFKFELERITKGDESKINDLRLIVIESSEASILPNIDGSLEFLLKGLTKNSPIRISYANSQSFRDYSLQSDFLSSWGDIFPSGAKTKISFVDSLNRPRESELVLWTADLDTESLEVFFRATLDSDYEEKIANGLLSPIEIPSKIRSIRISINQSWQIRPKSQ